MSWNGGESESDSSASSKSDASSLSQYLCQVLMVRTTHRREWIGTVSSWPSNFVYRDMAETGRQLSRVLRDPSGPHRCDIIIALTHAR